MNNVSTSEIWYAQSGLSGNSTSALYNTTSLHTTTVSPSKPTNYRNIFTSNLLKSFSIPLQPEPSHKTIFYNESHNNYSNTVNSGHDDQLGLNFSVPLTVASDVRQVVDCEYSFDDATLWSRMILIVFVMNTICVLGTFGNLLIIAVISRRRMISACRSNTYFLIALASVDTCIMIFTILLYVVEVVYDYAHSLFLYTLWFKYVKVVYFLSHVSQDSSIYLTVAASVERCISLYSPGSHTRLCSSKCIVPAWICVVVTMVIASVGTKYFEIDVHYDSNCTGFGRFNLAPSPLLQNQLYRTVHTLWFSNIAFIFLPFIALASLNSVIFYQLKVRRQHATLQALLHHGANGSLSSSHHNTGSKSARLPVHPSVRVCPSERQGFLRRVKTFRNPHRKLTGNYLSTPLQTKLPSQTLKISRRNSLRCEDDDSSSVSFNPCLESAVKLLTFDGKSDPKPFNDQVQHQSPGEGLTDRETSDIKLGGGNEENNATLKLDQQKRCLSNNNHIANNNKLKVDNNNDNIDAGGSYKELDNPASSLLTKNNARGNNNKSLREPQKKNKKKIALPNIFKASEKRARNREATVVLFSVVVVFLVCNLPSVLLTVAEHVDKGFFADKPALYSAARDCINLLTVINSAANIIIYLIFGSEFKKELRSLILDIRETACSTAGWKRFTFRGGAKSTYRQSPTYQAYPHCCPLSCPKASLLPSTCRRIRNCRDISTSTQVVKLSLHSSQTNGITCTVNEMSEQNNHASILETAQSVLTTNKEVETIEIQSIKSGESENHDDTKNIYRTRIANNHTSSTCHRAIKISQSDLTLTCDRICESNESHIQNNSNETLVLNSGDKWMCENFHSVTVNDTIPRLDDTLSWDSTSSIFNNSISKNMMSQANEASEPDMARRSSSVTLNSEFASNKCDEMDTMMPIPRTYFLTGSTYRI